MHSLPANESSLYPTVHEDRVDLGGILVEARPAHTVTLEVANFDCATTATVDNLGTTVGDATVGALLGSSGGTSTGISAKLLGDSTLAPDIATGIERARVEIRDIGGIPSLLGSWFLRTTVGIGDFVREWGSSFTQAHDSLVEQPLASSPTPCLLVELLKIFNLETILDGDACTVVTLVNLVGMARTIFVLGTSPAQNLDPGLYLVKSLAEMPHLCASLAQLSPDSTRVVLHSARTCRCWWRRPCSLLVDTGFADLVEFLTSLRTSSGLVYKAWPVMVVDSGKDKQVPLAHD
ncbi:hypothetical protein HG531_013218 [Fusarium graminearum]|nr:hypothetical protein HG531_013218 [Fusarium graminearum]